MREFCIGEERDLGFFWWLGVVCVCVCEGDWLILAIKCKGMGSRKDSWEATTGKR